MCYSPSYNHNYCIKSIFLAFSSVGGGGNVFQYERNASFLTSLLSPLALLASVILVLLASIILRLRHRMVTNEVGFREKAEWWEKREELTCGCACFVYMNELAASAQGLRHSCATDAQPGSHFSPLIQRPTVLHAHIHVSHNIYNPPSACSDSCNT